MKIKTGILGGSFNPIHNGHVALATELCKKKYVEEVWLLISPQNPLKTQSDLLDEKIRLALAQTAIRNIPNIQISDFEFSLPRPSYTWYTLTRLRSAYKNRDFSLIIGADNWLCFNQWNHPKEILKHHSVIIFPRSGYPVLPQHLPPKVILANVPIYPISSTQIRNRLQKHLSINGLVNPDVEQKILTKGYYQT